MTGSGMWLVRGGYGIFYDAGTLIENSALYFNPPYFSLQLFFPGRAAADARESVPGRARFLAARRDQHHRPGHPDRLFATGQPRTRRHRRGHDHRRALRDVARAEPGAEAQHQPGGARPRRDRFAPAARRRSATSCSSSRPRRPAITRSS